MTFTRKYGPGGATAKREVDFVWQADIEKPCPIQVRLHCRSGQPLPSGPKSFVGSYRPSRAYIAHMGEFNTLNFKGTAVFVIPAWSV